MELVPSEHPETRMNILLIGPPALGRAPKALESRFALGLEHIAAGDILRGEVAAGTPLGEKLKQHLDRGELAPTIWSCSWSCHAHWTHRFTAGTCLTVSTLRPAGAGGAQARRARSGAPDLVIYLDAPDDVLVARLLDRARAQGRTDDTEQVIRHRLRVFDEATAPLLAYYRDEGVGQGHRCDRHARRDHRGDPRAR